MPDVKQISPHAFALHLEDGRVYTLSNRGLDSTDSLLWQVSEKNWERMPQQVGAYRCVPYGWDNNLPCRLRDILDQNNLSPGVIRRQMGLIFGQGLHLYRTVFRGGEVIREWTEDSEVKQWLDTWDVNRYIEDLLTDYLHLNGCVSLLPLQRGSRLSGSAFISCLEAVKMKNARLEWVDSGDVRDVRHILVGDFEHGCLKTGVTAYPIFNPAHPLAHHISAMYCRTATFSRDFYALPSFWGTLRWIVRGSDIPSIFRYVTDNSLNMAYHIHSPQAYWDAKRATIRAMHPDMGDKEIEHEIAKLTERFLQSLTTVLSGKENAGKFFHTTDVVDENGQPQTWKIEPIDQKIKEFVEAQLKIGEASVSAITSGMGLHPSLSNIMVNGKLASGSELLYAFKLFLLSDTEIPSNTVFQALNTAIAVNCPGKGLKAGFYHTKLQRDEATSPQDRIINQ